MSSVVLIASGTLLLLAGVLGLRVMARRSVSLRALAAIAVGQDPSALFDERLVSRVPELLAHGLAQERDGRIEITRSGHRVARVAQTLRALLQVGA